MKAPEALSAHVSLLTYKPILRTSRVKCKTLEWSTLVGRFLDCFLVCLPGLIVLLAVNSLHQNLMFLQSYF